MVLYGVVNASDGARYTPGCLQDVTWGDRRRRRSAAATGTEVLSLALLIACARRRVYHRSVVRKCASFVFGLVLIVALGFAMAYAHSLKVPGASTGFSAPCEPASSAFNVAGESKAVSMIDATFDAENTEAPAGVGRRYRVETVAQQMPPAVPWVFPPLL